MSNAAIDDDDPAVAIIAAGGDPTDRIINEISKPIKLRHNNVAGEKPNGAFTRATYNKRKRMWEWPAGDVESLRVLIEDVAAVYRTDKEDWSARLDPARPTKRLGRNQGGPELPEPQYDYGADSGVGFENFEREWPDIYKACFARPPGKPSTNQAVKNGPPPIYLHGVVREVKQWWEAKVKQPFRPSFGGAEPYDYDNFSVEARLLHFMVRVICDPHYVLANTANLTRTERDNRVKPNKKGNKASKSNRP